MRANARPNCNTRTSFLPWISSRWGRSFLVMQYIEAQNLEARLNKSNPPLTRNEVHSIACDILNALGYAHSMGVVYRDVKPSKMLLDTLQTTGLDPDGAKIVELRFFGGYTDKETAQILGKNLAKVRRDWEFARSWLYNRLDATKE